MSEVSQGRRPEDVKPHEADPAHRDQPGGQERPLSTEETVDEALDDTFPASDPVAPKHIDGPNN